MQNLSILRNIKGSSRFQGPLHVYVTDTPLAPADRNHTPAIHRTDVGPGQTDVGAGNLITGGPLGPVD
jgi:hypothetical protein